MDKTPLYNLHLKYKAHIGEFGSWQMPIYYTGAPPERKFTERRVITGVAAEPAQPSQSKEIPVEAKIATTVVCGRLNTHPPNKYGIVAEHKAVRQKAGIFDLCHMGRLKVKGTGAFDLIQKLTTNDVSAMKLGDVQYSLICSHEGGILDDILTYRLENDYLLVVNAGNKQVILSWLQKWAVQTEIEDISNQMAMVAIQGPASEIILQKLVSKDLSLIGYYRFIQEKVTSIMNIISRTGYTGEDGFELYFDSRKAETLWLELLSAGKDYGLQPIGLGARDTLRLEASMPLYGNELNTRTNPLEANLERFVKLNKSEFIGKQALTIVNETGVRRKLIGFEMLGRAIPRKGYPVLKDGKCVGQVSSGSFSPTLNKNIGMGYVETEHDYEGCEFEIEIRGKPARARVTKTPFYKRDKE